MEEFDGWLTEPEGSTELGEVKDGVVVMISRLKAEADEKFLKKSAKWILAVELLSGKEGIHAKLSAKWHRCFHDNGHKTQFELRKMEDSPAERKSSCFHSQSFLGTQKSS